MLSPAPLKNTDNWNPPLKVEKIVLVFPVSSSVLELSLGINLIVYSVSGSKPCIMTMQWFRLTLKAHPVPSFGATSSTLVTSSSVLFNTCKNDSELHKSMVLNKTPGYHWDILSPPTLLKMPFRRMKAFFFSKYCFFITISHFFRIFSQKNLKNNVQRHF